MPEQNVALISGASRGIGRAIALALARRGMDIAIVYAGNTSAAESTLSEVTALGVRAALYPCDVSDYGATARLVRRVEDELGPVRVLVNNAGITRDSLLLRMDEEAFDRVVAVNLKGAYNLIRHCCAGFVRRREGRIVNITSVAGLSGNAGQANYSAAKAGLIGLTKSVARELAQRGITCNAVAPGLIDTDMTEAMPEKARESFLCAIPMRRAGSADEVAALVAFLCSGEASYLTGCVIPVDGGLSM